MRLTKHHALGNDFLIALGAVSDDLATTEAAGAVAAKALCDRRRGIGADGLIWASSDAVPVMVLHNADGSRAEMSGNGVRCLAQALVMAADAAGGTLRIATDAGERVVEVWPTDDAQTVLASVGMGAVTAIAEPSGWREVGVDPLRPVAHLSLGNPHSVVAVDDVAAVDLGAIGGIVADVNLEIITAGPEPDAITMRVHERGAGITDACGTGASAAAHAAAQWGMVGPTIREITVHMDGGDAKVRLGDDVVLIGPATYIATIEVPDP